MKLNNFVKFPLVLGIVGAICAGALGVVYEITNPIIQAAINAKANAAIMELVPEMDSANDLTDTFEDSVKEDLKVSSVKEVIVDDETYAYAYQVAGAGRNGDIVITIIISAKEEKILKLKVLSQSETADYWNKLVSSNTLAGFENLAFSDIGNVADLKVGATVSLGGVVDGVQKAIKFHKENILGEESTGIELTDTEITKLGLSDGQTLVDASETFETALKASTSESKYQSTLDNMGYIQFIDIKDASDAVVGHIYVVEAVYNCEVADHQRADQKFKFAYMFDNNWENGKIVVLSSSDSMADMPNPQPALGNNDFMNQFNGLSMNELSELISGTVDGISGATFTTTAVKTNIKAVVNAHTRAFGE